MKTKNINKKLVFNRNTVANLNTAEENAIIIGGSETYCVRLCPTPNSAICQVSFFYDDACTGSGFPESCAPTTCY
jgi:hypothetical protein